MENLEEKIANDPRPVFEKAFVFSKKYRLKLLLLALAPFFLDIALSVASLNSEGGGFLIAGTLSGLARTWFFVACSQLAFFAVKSDTLDLKTICSKSYSYLPKIFLSGFFLSALIWLVLTMSGISIGFFFRSSSTIVLAFPVAIALLGIFSFFLALFIWAPLFCAFEPLADEKDSGEEEVSIEDTNGNRFDKRPKVTYFKNKSISELGFVRSSSISVSERRVSLLAALLALLCLVIPNAFSQLLSGDSDMAKLVIQRALYYPLVCIFAPAVSYAFLCIVPRFSLREIGLKREDLTPLVLGTNSSWFARKLQTDGMIVTLVLFLLLSTGTFFMSLFNDVLVPESTEIKVVSAERKDSQLEVKFSVINPGGRVNWLDTEAFKALQIDKKVKKDESTPRGPLVGTSRPKYLRATGSNLNVNGMQDVAIDQIPEYVSDIDYLRKFSLPEGDLSKKQVELIYESKVGEVIFLGTFDLETNLIERKSESKDSAEGSVFK